jgi:hypothetical protein
MSEPPDILHDAALLVSPYLPPAFGAFVGLQWAKNQTPTQKLAGFVCGFGLGAYLGPALGEVLGLGPRGTVALGILIAVIGMDIVGGILAAAQSFRADPLSIVQRVVNIWRGTGGGGK